MLSTYLSLLFRLLILPLSLSLYNPIPPPSLPPSIFSTRYSNSYSNTCTYDQSETYCPSNNFQTFKSNADTDHQSESYYEPHSLSNEVAYNQSESNFGAYICQSYFLSNPATYTNIPEGRC